MAGGEGGELVEHRHREGDFHDAAGAVPVGVGWVGAAAGEVGQPFFVHSWV
ncbi:MAG: hypothetical protein ACRDS0_31650 [Pseudonocardiaceae bacterium]